MTTPSRRSTVFGLTFVVAFCSIVYELVYSELLTVIFGGTVARYSITIGLFLFSLGIGAFAYRYVDDDPANFFRLEVYLALTGPLGLVFIVAVNSVPVTGSQTVELVAETVSLWLSHLPIVVVGVLSGLEIPFLTDLADAETDVDFGTLAVVGSLGRGSRRLANGLLGLLFRVPGPDDAAAGPPDSGGEPDETGSFSAILGMDYLGSLVGTVTYALVLYPSFGLIAAVFVLGLLNAAAALAVYLLYRDRPADDPLARASFGTGVRALLVVCVVASTAYTGALAANDRVESELRTLYLEEGIEDEYPDRNMAVSIIDHETTRYQDIVLYDREWTGTGLTNRFPSGTETCLRLDTAIQFCESWVDSYHHGLVDVPAAFEPLADRNLSDDRVLLLGGGDWIAANYLRDHGATVDMVDPDREFQRYAKHHPFFQQYHDGAYRYENLTVHHEDAYAYLRGTDRQYDLVLLDLPGARSDDLLHLYSTEFYRQVRQHLTDDGLAVTWAYSRYDFPKHRSAYLTTVAAAGFDSYLPYRAYGDSNGDGRDERGELFYALSPGPTPALVVDAGGTYVDRHRDRYADREWHPVPSYRGLAPNSVFNPNYDTIVDYGP
ncbi:spermidine synthase [Halorientalis sp.]|uniref:spermidine synthase n=1 Tax=Halorientalis sp. TaxID=1931229 RepID=UPI0026267C86|nr:spermidine synthase [Halorientalis sp.]